MDDRELLEQFEQLTLPFDQWTHRTHVKVAFLYLRAFGLEEGLERMRRGIKAYNAANDVPETETTGYSETTTVAFMHLIHATMVAYGAVMPVETADAFCDTHPQLAQPTVLRLFYSPARRQHPAAKTSFVAPDLTALPRCPEGARPS
jgi:hypothetical protein